MVSFTRRVSRRTLLGDFVAVAGVTALAGCSGPAATATTVPAVPTPSPVQESAKAPTASAPAATAQPTAASAGAAPAPGQKTRIVMWGENAPDKYRPDIQNNFVKTFNDAHPSIELDYQFTQDEDRVTRTAVQAGSGPDIIVTPGPAFVLEYVAAGFIRPLDDYSRQYGWQNELQSWAYNASMANGKLWSVPLTFETMILYYNKTLFDQKGWKPPATRADMETIAKAAADEKIWPFAISNQFWKGVNEWLISVFYNMYAGADRVYQALSGKLPWTDTLFADSTKLIVDWAKKGWFSGSLNNYFSIGWDDHWGTFAKGKAAMNMEGTWGFQAAPTYFDTAKQTWDWTPIPALRAGVTPVYTLAIGTTVSINAKSKAPDAAAQVLDWLYNDKKRAAKIAFGYDFAEWVVPLKYTKDDLPKETDARVLRYFDAISDAVSKNIFGYTTWSFWPPKTDQEIIQDLDSVLTGKMSVEEYQKKQEDTFSGEMKSGLVPPAPEPSGYHAG